MKISIISAIGENNEIGKNNELLWYIKDDLVRFKRLTHNNVIIMGQKTYESLPIKPLPKRTNIVITNDYDISYKDCIMAYSIEDSLTKAEYWSNSDEVFVIGGGSIYEQFMEISQKLYITKVHHKFDADTYFPHIDKEQWDLISVDKRYENMINEYDFSFMIYENKLLK